MAHRLVVLPGDGIGPEVVAEARRVLEWFAGRRRLDLEIVAESFGLEAFRVHGGLIGEAALERVMAADAVLFGAVGGPGYEDVPGEVRRASGLLGLRRKLGVFANLRPIVAYDALAEASPLKPEVIRGVDMVIVRELTGGIYFGEPRGVSVEDDGTRRGVNTHVYTTPEIERIARVAFALARDRKGRLCSVDKSNVMEAGALWREVVSAIGAGEYPDVELSHLLADNCAMQIVRVPGRFDVVLADNLFGDILSDCAAVVSGSLGMLPSASLGEAEGGGRRRALYEPVHGSAPDIAGKGLANPLGAILSVAMALELSFARPGEAALLKRAVAGALAAGTRTADIAGPGTEPVSTGAMGDAVLGELDRLDGGS